MSASAHDDGEAAGEAPDGSAELLGRIHGAVLALVEAVGDLERAVRHLRGDTGTEFLDVRARLLGLDRRLRVLEAPATSTQPAETVQPTAPAAPAEAEPVDSAQRTLTPQQRAARSRARRAKELGGLTSKPTTRRRPQPVQPPEAAPTADDAEARAALARELRERRQPPTGPSD